MLRRLIRSMVRRRDANEKRRAALVCRYCGRPLGESVTQDHDGYPLALCPRGCGQHSAKATQASCCQGSRIALLLGRAQQDVVPLTNAASASRPKELAAPSLSRRPSLAFCERLSQFRFGCFGTRGFRRISRDTEIRAECAQLR
jgi:hypothetical protein